MLAHFCKYKFCTGLDVRKGYYHMKLSPETRHKGAFFTIFVKYEFHRIPFGIPQDPAYFSALMEKVLDQLNNFCFFHLDNVLVHDSNEKDHQEHLRVIFQKIRETGLKLMWSKCAFSK